MNIRPLHNALKELARNELNETSESLEEGLNEIKKFLDARPYIRARRDEQFLVIFLRSCKYDLAKATEKIEAYYKAVEKLPEIFKNIDTTNERFKEIMKLGIVIPFVNNDDEKTDKPRVFSARLTSHNPKEFKFEEILKAVLAMTSVMCMEDDNLVVAGEEVIVDLGNASIQHMLQFSPTMLKKLIVISQNYNPLRLFQIHFVNTPRGFETAFKLFKMLASTELASILKVHKNLESLQTCIPMSILPKEYGGKGESVEKITSRWPAKMEMYQKYFDEESNYGYDEKLAKEMSKK